MINFKIELGSGLSVYRQLMEQIRFYIASKAFVAGDKLPSVRALSKELRINPATVVKAYNNLQSEGIIELRQGRGAFVLERKVDEQVSTVEDKKELELKIKGIAVLAARIGLTEQELVDLVADHYKEVSNDESGGSK